MPVNWNIHNDINTAVLFFAYLNVEGKILLRWTSNRA